MQDKGEAAAVGQDLSVHAGAAVGHDLSDYVELAGKINENAGNVLAFFNLMRQCCTPQPGVLAFSGLKSPHEFKVLLEGLFHIDARRTLNSLTSIDDKWYEIGLRDNIFRKEVTLRNYFNATTKDMGVIFKQMQVRYGLGNIDLRQTSYKGFYPAIFKVMHLVFCYMFAMTKKSEDEYSRAVASLRSLIKLIDDNDSGCGCMSLTSTSSPKDFKHVSMHIRVLTFANAMHDWFVKFDKYRSKEVMLVDGMRYAGFIKARIFLQKQHNYAEMLFLDKNRSCMYLFGEDNSKKPQMHWMPPVESNGLKERLEFAGKGIQSLIPNGFRSAIRLCFREYEQGSRIDRLLKNIISIGIYANIHRRCSEKTSILGDDCILNERHDLYISNWWYLLLSCAVAELNSKSPLTGELLNIMRRELKIISDREWSCLRDNLNSNGTNHVGMEKKRLSQFKMEVGASVSELCESLPHNKHEKDYPTDFSADDRRRLTDFLQEGPTKMPDLRTDDEVNIQRINLQYKHLTSWLNSFALICERIIYLDPNECQSVKLGFIITSLYCQKKAASINSAVAGSQHPAGSEQQGVTQPEALGPNASGNQVALLLDEWKNIESGDSDYGQIWYINSQYFRASILADKFKDVLQQLSHISSDSSKAGAALPSNSREDHVARDHPLDVNGVSAGLMENAHPPGGSPMQVSDAEVQPDNPPSGVSTSSEPRLVKSQEYKKLEGALEEDFAKTSLEGIVKRFISVAAYILDPGNFKDESNASIVKLFAIMQHFVCATHDFLRLMRRVRGNKSSYTRETCAFVDRAVGFFEQGNLLGEGNIIRSLRAKVSEDKDKTEENEVMMYAQEAMRGMQLRNMRMDL